MENNRKILDKLIKESEIHVYETSHEEYFKMLKKDNKSFPLKESDYKGKGKKLSGAYHPQSPEFIFIYEGYKDFIKILIFLHEYSHYLCKNEGCSCSRVADSFLAEYHSMEYTLKECFEKKYLMSLYHFMKLILFKYSEIDPVSKRISGLITITKLWEKCKNLLEENNYDIFFKKKAHLAKL